MALDLVLYKGSYLIATADMKVSLGLFLVAWVNSRMLADNSIYGVTEGTSMLETYIQAIKDMANRGVVRKNSFKLRYPHQPIRVSDSRLMRWLPRALISICSQSQVDAGKCVCNKFQHVDIFSNKQMDAQAAVAVRHKRLIVSYRPTISKKNWETNANNNLVRYPKLSVDIKVHQGFLRHLASIQAPTEAAVLRHLKDPKNKHHSLYITGFSLGGSVAALSTPMWHRLLKKHNLKNKIKVFIYSNPRPGNANFSNYLNSLNIPIIRYAKSDDVVPHLPPQEQGYSQVGKEHLQSKSLPTIPCSNRYAEDPQCGLKYTNFNQSSHFLPFNSPMPTPPFC
ncbi:hypothetical protein DSO57_1036885 [Entomophthora muscae]|uniref:Uncharacterized protein n=1 Tax=Entomophthora muscae TaxID=34485 RepID=A0ACC2TXS9_9FUNG|nr:hypothetical protein DSO57_1036885 [Entomophthora muscae]